MSLDVYLEVVQPTTVYTANVTHNLATMAREAGLYMPLWRPDEMHIDRDVTAADLIEPLREGLRRLVSEPARFYAMNPSNGWGTYDGLVTFVRRYLAACEDNPEAKVRVSR